MMDREIIISAGHHLKDPGAISHGIQENNLCMKFRDHLAHSLRMLGFRVVTPVDSFSLHETIKFSKEFPSVPAIDLHFNAFNEVAKGTEAYCKRADVVGTAICKAMCIASESFGFHNRGVKTAGESARGRLGFVDTIKHGMVFEVCFMDNPNDMSLVDEPHEVKSWGETIAKAIDDIWDTMEGNKKRTS